MKDQQTLCQMVIQEAKEAGVDQHKAAQVFLDAYEEHKRKYGSFKHSDNYAERMQERYQYQYDKAMEYIKAERGEWTN